MPIQKLRALGRLGMQWTSSRSVCQRVGGGRRLGEGQGIGSCYGDWWGGENWHIVAEGWAQAWRCPALQELNPCRKTMGKVEPM